ncbi:MAG: hypothetical protein ACFE0J_21150 [Elainellaceae cyanobacterium]
MSRLSCPDYTSQLQHCLDLAEDVSKHSEATQQFEDLRERVAAHNPEAADLLTMLWQDALSNRRSAIFWQELCNVEKELTNRMAESHMQLRQNYLRLMQEQ